MDRPDIIDLSELAKSRSADITRILAAINGAAGCAIWTSEVRAAVRGGKPLGGPQIEESLESEHQD